MNWVRQVWLKVDHATFFFIDQAMLALRGEFVYTYLLKRGIGLSETFEGDFTIGRTLISFTNSFIHSYI